jgi:hypothetical protein
MEGPLRVNLHEWGLFNSIHLIGESKIKMPGSRFPSPWSSEEHSHYFVVRDGNGRAIAYVYFEHETRPAIAAKLLTKDEARRIAASFAKLPELLRKTE